MHVIEIRCSSNAPNLNLPTLIRSLHWPAGTVECPGKEVVPFAIEGSEIPLRGARRHPGLQRTGLPNFKNHKGS